MPEPRPDSPSTFRIPIAYTDEELASYERIIVRRQKQSAGPAAGGGVIATGVVVALLGGFLGVAAGIVSPRGGSLLAVLVFGGFWIGAWASVIWSKRRTARILLARRDAFRADLRNASILVTNAGIFTRSNTIRSFYAFSAIKASSQEGGFVLLWTRPESAIAIPLRLLSPIQRDWLLSHPGAMVSRDDKSASELLLRADQRLRGQHRLYHEAAGTGVHHADSAQCQQRDGLNGVTQSGRVFPIVRRQWPDEGFMQRAKQRGGGQRGILRRQMAGAHRGFDPGADLAGDLAAAGDPRRRDIDIDRFGQNAPGKLALRQHMHRNRGDGRGQRRGRPRCCVRGAADGREFVARDVRDQLGNQVRLGGEVTIDGSGGDIGPDRDRRDLHRGHAAIRRGTARRRQNGATPRRKPFHHLVGSPIDHARASLPWRGFQAVLARPGCPRLDVFGGSVQTALKN
jgi:hypothetical protein